MMMCLVTALLAQQFGTALTSRYTIPVHVKLADAACSTIQTEMPNFALNCSDGILQKGIIWPDCPKVPERDDLRNSCVTVRGNTVGLHSGLKEMVKQGAYQMYLRQKKRFSKETPDKMPDPEDGTKENGMSNYRLFQQHWHASPPPPLDEENGRLVDNNPRKPQRAQFAVVTNVDLRNKMLEQLSVWYCKAMRLAAASRTARLNNDNSEERCAAPREMLVRVGVDEMNCEESKYTWQLSRFEVGKMLHTVTDSFSLSHVRRHFCPGTSLSFQSISGECHAVDPGDAHDEAVKEWQESRAEHAGNIDQGLKAEQVVAEKAKDGDEPDDKITSLLDSTPVVQTATVHTILHHRHRQHHQFRRRRKPEEEGYMDAPERMVNHELTEDIVSKKVHVPTPEDDEVALRSAKIQQFYSMDDTDWGKHGKADNIDDDWRYDLASAATRRVLRKFSKFVVQLDKSGGSDAELETDSLHAMLRLLCDEIFPMDEATAAQGAGGSDKRLGLNGVTWMPTHTLLAENAYKYFESRGVLMDFPLGQGDICDLASFADYHRSIAHGGDMQLPKEQTSFGLGSCDAVMSEPLELNIANIKLQDDDDEPAESGSLTQWPFVATRLLLPLALIAPYF